jgi:protein O-GlcNAc transferase
MAGKLTPRVNDPCPCGSGRKFKRCHGAPAAPAPVAAAALLAAAQKAIDAGRLPEAQDAYLAVLATDAGNLDALLGMAALSQRAGDAAAAQHYHGLLAKRHPDDARAQFALGNHYAMQYDLERARAHYRRVVELSAASSGAWNNLGNVEKYLGNTAQAIACYERAVAADPGNVTLHSNLLISLHYDLAISHEELFARHLAWAQRHAAPFYPAKRRWPNDPDPERRLRIGFVSNGFDGRIVGHFLRSVVSHHDRDRFAAYAYSSTRQPDAMTAALRAAFDQWREIGALSDDSVAAQVERDAIDILVDLDGHAPGSRLLVFARKPAPVQLTWLDYFNTTGMRTVDFILTDAYTTPIDSPQRFVEAPLRLPHTRLCYTPVAHAPDVSALPCSRRDVFTFGSFNRYDKLGAAVIDCWAEILLRVPASRLIVKNAALAVAGARAALERRFADRGVAPGRIELRSRSPHAAMLAEYADVDLALDTFPYNGGLTSCEALWMGVPMVALEGERMISRQTAAILRLIGGDSFIARTRSEYVDVAVRWTRALERLAALRSSLRERMRSSALCDGERFARDLEGVLRSIWRAYCARVR